MGFSENKVSQEMSLPIYSSGIFFLCVNLHRPEKGLPTITVTDAICAVVTGKERRSSEDRACGHVCVCVGGGVKYKYCGFFIVFMQNNIFQTLDLGGNFPWPIMVVLTE